MSQEKEKESKKSMDKPIKISTGDFHKSKEYNEARDLFLLKQLKEKYEPVESGKEEPKKEKKKEYKFGEE